MINSYAAERAAIEEQFTTVWQDTSPVLFDNTRQKLPKTGSAVRFKIVGTEKLQKSIGTSQLHRNIGQVFIEIYIRKGTGLDKLEELTDKAIGAFDVVQIDSIQFRAGYQIIVGDVDNDWFQANVIIPFYRNSIVTQA